MTIDQAVESYEQSIEDAINQFVKDTQELDDDGLSTEEILAIIAAIDITSYFIEELQFAAAQNAYMAATETILADLPFFGVATEQQLLALQNIQRFNIEGLTRHVTANMQASMAQGIASKLDRGPMAELMRSNIKTTIPRVENIIGTQLGNYRRAVIMQMAVDLPESALYDYIGPRDEKNRPVCRQFLDSSPLTEQEIRSIKADAMETGGGINCRHYWYPIDV
tara:strand:+ start:225 stop:893 length:669 start_codon:yes stop_codon:yes gene_type:complete